MSSLHNQISGSHYKRCKIQPAEFIHANGLGYFEGCAIKYVVRHRDKGGADDLRKAIHYMEMLLELEYGETKKDPAQPPAPESVVDYALLPGASVIHENEVRTNGVAYCKWSGNRWLQWHFHTGQWGVASAWITNCAPEWPVATAEQLEGLG